MSEKNNHHGNQGRDPQPDKGNDNNGHQNNGQGHDSGHGRPPSRPSKPGHSHPSVGIWNNLILKD